MSTRRLREGGSDAETEGRARFALVSINVPPNHRIGVIERSSFGVNDARRDFTVLSRRSVEEADFLEEMAARVSARSGPGRDVLLYVHGYEVSLDEARFRAAQIVNDTRFQGVPALFTWDSNGRSGLRAYEADRSNNCERSEPGMCVMTDSNAALTLKESRQTEFSHSLDPSLPFIPQPSRSSGVLDFGDPARDCQNAANGAVRARPGPIEALLSLRSYQSAQGKQVL